MKLVNNILVKLIIFLLAVVAAELFVRHVIKDELVFGSWYSRGIHVADKDLGIKFKPHYVGTMSHAEGPWGVPLMLNDKGFRPVVENNRLGEIKKVHIIGGRSMMFAYGLPEKKTIHYHVSEQSKKHIQVVNCSWPGLGLISSYRAYHKFLEKNTESPDVVVLCFYEFDLSAFEHKIISLTDVESPADPENIFGLSEGCQRRQRGRLEKALGRYCYESYVLYGMLKYHHGYNNILSELFRKGTASAPTVKKSHKPQWSTNFSDYITRLDEHFKSKGSTMIVVILPIAFPDKEFYSQSIKTFPEQVPCYNLHETLYEKIQQTTFHSMGHYGSEATKIIGKELAKLVDQHLQNVK